MNKLDYVHINIDDYLEDNCGQFVEFLKIKEIKETISNTKKAIIIEGVCLLAVIEKLRLDLGILIYIKRTSSFGMWHDEKECDVQIDIEEFIKNKNEDLRRFAEAEASIEGRSFDPDENFLPQLKEEIIRYHYKYKPHRKADLIYKRVD